MTFICVRIIRIYIRTYLQSNQSIENRALASGLKQLFKFLFYFIILHCLALNVYIRRERERGNTDLKKGKNTIK